MKKQNTAPQAGIIAGASILLMAITAGFSLGFVLEQLVLPTDAATTAANIKAGESLFRWGLLGWLLILICDLLAAWALHILLQSVRPSLSLLTAWLRLAYALVLGVAMLNLLLVLLFLGDAEYLNVWGSEERAALALLFIQAFHDCWSLGLIVFGTHLLGLGYLVWKAPFLPTVIGITLIIGGMGYLLVHLGGLLWPHSDQILSLIETIFLLPMIIGELGLGLYLLIKRPQMESPNSNTTL